MMESEAYKHQTDGKTQSSKIYFGSFLSLRERDDDSELGIATFNF